MDKMKAHTMSEIKRHMGDVLLTALNDPKTVEILLNADGQLWQEKLGDKMRPIGTMQRGSAEMIIKAIAGFHEKEITKLNPLLEGELPLDGSRFAGQLPPVVSAPTFAIRKRAVSVFSLNDYVESQVMTAFQRDILLDAVAQHRNILVIGGTGSGKTTLINAIIQAMVDFNQEERVFIIEDTGEIQCAAVNCVQYHTTSDISMTKLLKTTLRMRPDRILVGEVRGAEALDLLMAWNTGHEGGAATLHANHARAGLDRLSTLISMHADAPRMIEPLIAEAVHLVVHIARTEQGRKLTEIIALEGYQSGQYQIKHLDSERSSRNA
jgi:type IV secretion system protein TrbB